MPTYKVTDPQSGKVMSFTGDTPPTKDVLDQAFAKVNQPQQSNGQSGLNTILSLLGGGLGGAAGATAGAAGGALIPGADLTGVPEAAGGYAGAVTGAGMGAAAGNGAADMINNLLFGKNIDPAASQQNTIDAGKSGAIGEAAGIPIGKTLGLIAHPIQPFIDMVDKKLASSAKTVDFSQLLNDYQENVLPKLRQQGYGQKATEAFNELRNNITDAVSAFKPHQPAQAGSDITDIADMKLPISQANQLKRNLSQKVSDYYGYDTGRPNIEASKQFGSLLRNNIAQQEPGVQTPNAIASAMYKVPDSLSALTNILALGQPGAARAINTVSSIPSNIVQKIVPQGGGYLNPLLSRILQLGVQQGGQNQ